MALPILPRCWHCVRWSKRALHHSPPKQWC